MKRISENKRIDIARERMREDLKQSGTSNNGISLALGSGLQFLSYYKSAHIKRSKPNLSKGSIER